MSSAGAPVFLGNTHETEVLPYNGSTLGRSERLLLLLDPYHSAAMLSLEGIKSFGFARQASARRKFSARLIVQNKAFYSLETQHGRREIKLYESSLGLLRFGIINTLTGQFLKEGRNCYAYSSVAEHFFFFKKNANERSISKSEIS